MDLPIGSLRTGDEFRITPDGLVLDITSNPTPHPVLPGVVNIDIHADGMDDTLVLPESTLVEIVAAPRTAAVPCLTCLDDFTVDTDLASSEKPRTGLCGPCNRRVSLAVITSR